ncbi:MAG: ribosomal protein S18-alanine N-acetyltransferase [Endomicrobiaceae bacterium]
MNIIISDFKEENLNQTVEIENRNSYNPWTAQMFMDEYNNKNSFFKIACLENIIIGFIIYHIIFDESEILNIVIDTSFRKQKFGEKLLQYVINDVKHKNVKKIFLEVRESNKPAINLYKKNGFTEYNIRKKYYNNENAVLMKKFL